MLDSNQIERELKNRGFKLNIDNAHARGFNSQNEEILVFVKTARSLKEDPLTPVFAQPLVLHWSIKDTNQYPKLIEITRKINANYKNHNMRGFEGPGAGDKPNGVAVDVDSSQMLDEILSFISGASFSNLTPTEDLTAAQAELAELPATTRKAVVDARLGQGKFRNDLIELWGACAVTGCSVPKMLRASHMKPWRDSDNSDRLNKFNGLLLTANLDQAFDQGLISFDVAGHILIKTDLFNCDDLAALNIQPLMKLRELHDKHQPFLAEHRRLNHFDK